MSFEWVNYEKLRNCHSAEATLATKKETKTSLLHQIILVTIFGRRHRLSPCSVSTFTWHRVAMLLKTQRRTIAGSLIFPRSLSISCFGIAVSTCFHNFVTCKVVSPLCSGLLQLLQKASDSWHSEMIESQNVTDLNSLNSLSLPPEFSTCKSSVTWATCQNSNTQKHKQIYTACRGPHLQKVPRDFGASEVWERWTPCERQLRLVTMSFWRCYSIFVQDFHGLHTTS